MPGEMDKLCITLVPSMHCNISSFFNGHHCWDSHADSWCLCES